MARHPKMLTRFKSRGPFNETYFYIQVVLGAAFTLGVSQTSDLSHIATAAGI